MAKQRLTGGISGKGSSNVNPTYKETRMANAIKAVKNIDPVVKQKLEDMYSPKNTNQVSKKQMDLIIKKRRIKNSKSKIASESRITNIKKDKATSNRLVENFIASKRKSK
jgi:hypothetical protein